MAADAPRVWFNQGPSSTFDVLESVRAADPERRVVLCASHRRATSVVLTAADERWTEPADDLPREAYVAWALDQVRQRGIALLFAHRRRIALAERRAEFAALGCRLLVAGDAAAMRLVDDKAAFYEAMSREPEIAPFLPAWRVFEDAAGFDAAFAELAPRHRLLCVKPAVSVFGYGFLILEPPGDRFAELTQPVRNKVAPEVFRAALAATTQRRRMLLMPFLEGPERSVDALAREGRLLAAVSRRKHLFSQHIEPEGPSHALAGAIARALGLDGIFNLQTRDHQGRPAILEVNSRMSGGILYSCQSLALPWWAILIALDLARPEDIPAAQTDMRLALVNRIVRLPLAGA